MLYWLAHFVLWGFLFCGATGSIVRINNVSLISYGVSLIDCLAHALLSLDKI